MCGSTCAGARTSSNASVNTTLSDCAAACTEPRPAGRQHHRLYGVRIRFGREMAGAPQTVGDAEEIKRGVADFARAPNGGLVVIPSGSVSRHHNLIIAL